MLPGGSDVADIWRGGGTSEEWGWVEQYGRLKRETVLGF